MTKQKRPYRTYTREFKVEAIRLMETSDRPAAKIARELGIPRNRLYKWKNQLASKGDQAFTGAGRSRQADQSELATLKQENEWLKKKNEILKMAAAPDRLKRQFQTGLPDQAWVSDTSFVPTRQGWLFLAVTLDLFSRQVIGWARGNRDDSELVSDALATATWRRAKAKDVIVHSDRGATYASGDYQKLLDRHRLLCSISRKGESLDNAVAESFFSSLKTELFDHEDYRTRKAAKQSLFQYIEIFYNR